MKTRRRLPVRKVYERGTICQWKAYERGISSARNGIYKGKGSDIGAESPRINFLLVLPGGSSGRHFSPSSPVQQEQFLNLKYI